MNVARKLKVDPELALRSSSGRFRGAVERAEELAAQQGRQWTDLALDEQITFYAQARLETTETRERNLGSDRTRPRPPGPRLARQPHRRGRGLPALRRLRHAPRCRRAPRPASSRRPSCATAARRGRQGRHAGGRERQRRDRRGRARHRRRRPGARSTARSSSSTARPNKSRLGANAILGVSLATAHAAAAEEGQPLWRYLGGEAAHVLPVPMMNVLNGGAHADNKVDFQEFMIVPVGAPSFSEGLRYRRGDVPRAEEDAARRGARHRRAATRAASRPISAPTRRRCEFLVRGIEAAGYTPGEDVAIALDPAVSELYEDGTGYVLEHEGRTLSAEELAALLGRPQRPLPDPLDRGRHGRGGLGRLEGPDRAGSATRSSSSATTCSSRTRSACAAASSSASATRSS